MELLSGNLVDDEESWAKEQKCNPPYAVVHFGPTSLHAATEGYRKVVDESIHTYEAFAHANEELREFESKALPSIEMALACAFGAGRHPVSCLPVERVVYGLTPDKVTLHDISFVFCGTAYGSTPICVDELTARITELARLADTLEPRVAEFFHLGLRDEDVLKRFLYFFLAVEIAVHKSFRRVTRAQHLANAATLDTRTAKAVAFLLEKRDENWTNLVDRFVWCVVSVWTHLTEHDIDEFKRLKKVRDGIAHGDVATPDHASVSAIEKLAMRVHAAAP
jgi:hypothetical protein